MNEIKPDPVISGFFKKYGATRARPDGSPSDEFILRQIGIYQKTIETGRLHDGGYANPSVIEYVRKALAKLQDEAKKRGLVVP